MIEFYGSTKCEGRQSGVLIWLVRDNNRYERAVVCICGRGGKQAAGVIKVLKEAGFVGGSSSIH